MSIKKYVIALAAVVVVGLGTESALAQQAVGPAFVYPFVGGGGSVASGSAVSGCTINSFVYIDGSGNLTCAATPVNGSTTTAGNGILTLRAAHGGTGLTDGFSYLLATMPSGSATPIAGQYVNVFGQGAGAGAQYLFSGLMSAGYTGAGETSAVKGQNSSVGTNTGITAGNTGLRGVADGNGTTGYNIGVGGTASRSTVLNIGVSGLATIATGTPTNNIGVLGLGLNSSNPIAGYFGMSLTPTFGASAAIVGDNAATGADIIDARANATSVWKVNGTGYVQGTRGEVALNANFTNATITFASTTLSVDVVSGRTYAFDMMMLMSDSVAADGMKVDFNGGAATMTIFGTSCTMSNDTTGASVAFTAATSAALATVINVPTMASTGVHMLRCNGFMVPSSSSTFIVRAAQNAHTTGTLTINRGSWLSVRDARPL